MFDENLEVLIKSRNIGKEEADKVRRYFLPALEVTPSNLEYVRSEIKYRESRLKKKECVSYKI